jgi:hypothetical protein
MIDLCCLHKGVTEIITFKVGKSSTGHEVASKMEAREEASSVHFVFRDSPLRPWRDFSALDTSARCPILFYFRQTLLPSSLFQFLPPIRNGSLLSALFAPEVPARSANLIGFKILRFQFRVPLFALSPRETSWLPLPGPFKFRNRRQSGRRFD